MQTLKETVMLLAIQFVHKELWVGHVAWKYVSIADRFKVSHEISSLYKDILRNCPPSVLILLTSGFIETAFTRNTKTSMMKEVMVEKAPCSFSTEEETGEELVNIFATANRHHDSLVLLQMLQSHLHAVHSTSVRA